MSDSIDDILAVSEDPAYVRVATARVLLRQDLAARAEELDAELAAAIEADRHNLTLADAPRAPELAEALAQFEEEAEAAKVSFRFRAIGKRAWVDLLAKHPPTAEQARRISGLDHNPESFPAAAVAASCAEPAMTLEQAQRLERSLNLTQWDRLWQACLQANIGDDVPKSAAAGMLRRLSGAYERQPTTIASPVQSSSDAS